MEEDMEYQIKYDILTNWLCERISNRRYVDVDELEHLLNALGIEVVYGMEDN